MQTHINHRISRTLYYRRVIHDTQSARSTEQPITRRAFSGVTEQIGCTHHKVNRFRPEGPVRVKMQIMELSKKTNTNTLTKRFQWKRNSKGVVVFCFVFVCFVVVVDNLELSCLIPGQWLLVFFYARPGGVSSRLKIQDYFIISSEKLKRG